MKNVLFSAIFLAFLGATADAQQFFIYDRRANANLFTSAPAPFRVFGDTANTIYPHGDGFTWEVSSFEFVYAIFGSQTIQEGHLAAQVKIYESIQEDGVGSVFSNPIISEVIGLPGAHTSTTTSYSVNSGILSNPATLSPNTASLGFTISFIDPTTGSGISGVYPVVQRQTSATLGSSTRGYYQDLNDDGVLTASEKVTGGNTTTDPNDDLVFAIYANKVQAVPEPASFAVIGLGLLGLARRRRSSK